MSNSYSTEVSEFCLEGRFLEFVIKDGYKLKGFRLSTSEGECYVKLAKHLRIAFNWGLPPGTWLQVVGEKKQNYKTGEIKLKAQRVMAATTQAQTSSSFSMLSADEAAKPKPKKATILMCQKSDCMKRGGKAVCQALENALSDRGLTDQVNIKPTGCMKNCKAGPNLVMPDKTRYSRIQASQVPAIIDKHLSTSEDNQKLDPKRNEELAIAAVTTI